MDEYNRPLYGDVFGVLPKVSDTQYGEPVDKNNWGELEPEEGEIKAGLTASLFTHVYLSEEEEESESEEEEDSDYDSDDGKPRRRKKHKKGEPGGPLTGLPTVGYGGRRKKRKNGKEDSLATLAEEDDSEVVEKVGETVCALYFNVDDIS